MFSWIFFIFGAFIWTAVKLYLDYRKHEEETDEPPDNVALRFVRRRFNATDYRGTKLTVVENGKRLITPMLIVISCARQHRSAVCVGLHSGDLRPHPGAVPRVHRQRVCPDGTTAAVLLARRPAQGLVYLSVGLAIILGFIGVKLILHALHSYHLADWAPWDGEIPIWVSTVMCDPRSRGQPGQVEVRPGPAGHGDSEGEQSGSDRGVVRRTRPARWPSD